eukprot:scaffold229164_cov27-Tisochrysis_lutea.AAC.8
MIEQRRAGRRSSARVEAGRASFSGTSFDTTSRIACRHHEEGGTEEGRRDDAIGGVKGELGWEEGKRGGKTAV